METKFSTLMDAGLVAYHGCQTTVVALPSAYDAWLKAGVSEGTSKEEFLNQAHKVAVHLSQQANGETCNAHVANMYYMHVVAISSNARIAFVSAKDELLGDHPDVMDDALYYHVAREAIPSDGYIH
jgi:hypothetical protein